MKKKSGRNNRWQDHYARRAKKERYPARSVYKLKEIQEKYHLIKKGHNVLDLGCSPGSWLLYGADLTGKKGRVVGLDIKAVSQKMPDNVDVHICDILSMDDVFFKSLGSDFNVVLSDMAPDTTGNKHVDGARSFNLCMAALNTARHVLKIRGVFVCKIFHGEQFTEFLNCVKQYFGLCKIYKPKSSRKSSKEIYIIGLDKK